jgi:hypothetical protein
MRGEPGTEGDLDAVGGAAGARGRRTPQQRAATRSARARVPLVKWTETKVVTSPRSGQACSGRQLGGCTCVSDRQSAPVSAVVRGPGGLDARSRRHVDP